MFFGILIFDPKWGFCKGYSLCMMADSQNVLILEYLVFFRAVFCTEQLLIICRMDFDVFFGILNFDSKWALCKGYSLCMMADSQNVLILEYLVFFRAVFCTEQLLIICRMDFDVFFGILNFDSKWALCKGYSLCMMADSQNVLILEYLVFFRAVFCTEQLLIICRMDFDVFFGILIFDPKWGFCKGYSLCMKAIF